MYYNHKNHASLSKLSVKAGGSIWWEVSPAVLMTRKEIGTSTAQILKRFQCGKEILIVFGRTQFFNVLQLR
jgi:hypothetical protein